MIIPYIYSLILPWAVGYLFSRALLGKEQISLQAHIGLGFGFGFGLLAQIMLVLALIGIHWNVFIISSILFIILIILFFKQPSGNWHTKSNELKTPDSKLWLWINRALLTYIILKILYALIYTFAYPIFEWDSLATAVFQAKVFYYERTSTIVGHLPWPSYPHQIQYSLCWISMNLGEWNDHWTKIIFPLYFLSFLLVFYFAFKRICGQKNAMIGIAIVVSSPFFYHHGMTSYRDMTLSFYTCIPIILFILWARERGNGYLWMAGLFSGFATFTKLEGSAYFFVHILVLLYIIRQLKLLRGEMLKILLKFLCPSLALLGLYSGFKFIYGIPQNVRLKSDLTLASFGRIPTILNAFTNELSNLANWNIIWLLALTLIFCNFSKLKNDTVSKSVILSLILFFGIHLLVAATTWNFEQMLSPFTLSRIILHFFPLSVLLIIQLNPFLKMMPSCKIKNPPPT